MGAETLDYTAILADLEAKKAALEASIQSLRQAIAAGALGQVGDVPAGVVGSSVGSSGEVPVGAFLGRSIPEAAKIYLEIVKKKQTSQEIAEGLKRGGIESTSKNFVGIVRAILDRAGKAGTGIVKLDRSYWGLSDWYHPGLRNAVTTEKRPTRKKKSRKARSKANDAAKTASAVQPPAASAAPAIPVWPGSKFDQITQLLRSNPATHYSSAEVGQKLGFKSNVATMMLGKLVQTGKVEKTQDGKYGAVRVV